MKENGFDDEMVECHYKEAVIYIPVKLFTEMTMRTQVPGQKFIRYKQGAKIYGMSERSFYELANEAGAVHEIRGMRLVKIDTLDNYIEYFKK